MLFLCAKSLLNRLLYMEIKALSYFNMLGNGAVAGMNYTQMHIFPSLFNFLYSRNNHLHTVWKSENIDHQLNTFHDFLHAVGLTGFINQSFLWCIEYHIMMLSCKIMKTTWSFIKLLVQHILWGLTIYKVDTSFDTDWCFASLFI